MKILPVSYFIFNNGTLFIQWQTCDISSLASDASSFRLLFSISCYLSFIGLNNAVQIIYNAFNDEICEL